MTDQKEDDCCGRMNEHQTGTCDRHSRVKYPDFLFGHSARFDEYGLMHSDRMPKLLVDLFPESKRERGFDALEAIGIGDALLRTNIPERFKTAEWRRDMKD